jgi:hypothetical protein
LGPGQQAVRWLGNVGSDDPVNSVAFHVRGNSAALFIVAEILNRLGLRAVAPGTQTASFALEDDALKAVC